MPPEPKARKQISERRRIQNRRAQKNYRERQKRHLQSLQDLADCVNAYGSLSNQDQRSVPEPSPPSLSTLDITCRGSATSAHQHVQQISNNLNELSGSQEVLDITHFNVNKEGEYASSYLSRNLLCNPQQTTGHPSSASLDEAREYDITSQLLLENGLLDEGTRNLILKRRLTLADILKSGLHALTQNVGVGVEGANIDDPNGTEKNDENLIPRTDKIVMLQNRNRLVTESLPDIYKNNLRIKQFMFVAACLANAEALGIGLPIHDHLCEDDTESPFFKAEISEEVAKRSCTTGFSDLKRDLRPCASQVTHSHHPYIDVLPFPTFRERIIKLACSEPPMIDEDELCSDLQNDGLICWGSSLGGGSSALGSGSPWDMRSWEAQPWFLRKWWILLGGADGEVYHQTQWWCEMRGDRSLYPW
ncbi:hypothetical protein F5884DRAFT_769693 [Xylogone sp. PMI_703]|nr:hypothetical protein F5884DRAFT_769693 [Xylogone sp. PMI_703]